MVISFIIPVYNTEKQKLKRCVESVFSTHSSKFEKEIILVDDGSDTFTANFCDDLSDNGENIRVIHKPNSGVSSARNVGIEEAKGEYLFFVDSDDIVLCEGFSKLIVKDKDIYFTDIIIVKENDGRDIGIKPFKTRGNKSVGQVIARIALNGDINGCWGKLIKASFIKDKGIRFDENMITGEDAKFLIDILKNNPQISYIPIYTYKYYYDIKTSDNRLISHPDVYLDNELFFLLELKELSRHIILEKNKLERITNKCDERAVKQIFNGITALIRGRLYNEDRKRMIFRMIENYGISYDPKWSRKTKIEYRLVSAKKWTVINCIGRLRYLYLMIKGVGL